MKRKIAAMAACLASSCAFAPVMAADVYTRGSTKDAPGDYIASSAARSWSGLYIGIEAGGGVGVFDAVRNLQHGLNTYHFEDANGDWTHRTSKDVSLVNDPAFFVDDQHHSVDLGLNGVFGGVNVELLRQIDTRIVLGIGADFDFGNMKGSDTFSRDLLITDGRNDYSLEHETNRLTAEQKWNGDLMAKLGYLVTPDSMIYARAGVSWAKFAVKGNSQLSLLDGNIEPFPSSSLDNSETLTGWKVALGGSTRINTNLVGSVEGAYADYGSISDAFGKSKDLTPDANCRGLAGTTADAVNGDLTGWTVKAKLTYQITD